MKHGAFTFAFLLAAGALGSVAFAGCGGDDKETTPTADTGVVGDTGGAVDTGATDTYKPETAPYTCAAPLPTGFACEEPAGKAGKTVCTDEAIDAIVTGCFSDTATSTTCTNARAKYKACDACTLTDWLVDFIWADSANCIKKVAPTDPCAKSIQCNFDCMLEICSTEECDTTPGSGKTTTSSEWGDCIQAAQAKGTSTKPRGACYDIATKDYSACASKDGLGVCFPRSDYDYVLFFRGACRDGGDWSNVTTDKPSGDAGTETGGETGGETGTGDAAGETATDASGD
ncbi:MAG: hypothetical protein HYV09_06310 [Deltaproteobacteria bacterium]|nr:hypothetical protein [Deltaproteobacteria bacterium]